MMIDSHILNLLTEYLTGEISEQHQVELERWLDEREGNRQFFEKFCADRSFRERWELRQKIDLNAALQKFESRTGDVLVLPMRKRWRLYAAVAAMLVLAIGISWFYLRQTAEIPEVAKSEIVPGNAKAVLVLADGEKVNLGMEDTLSVDLASGGQVVNKGKQLIYKGKQSAQMEYNELRIPRGGEYDVVLSDGTVVKLNAGSSLKYPIIFDSSKREVYLSGEAWFEIKKDVQRPFYVIADNLKIRVYGTKFNVNTSSKDCIETVLVEGSVGIQTKQSLEEYVLKPSQLARFSKTDGSIKIKTVDVLPYVGWKDGLLIFHNENLEKIMNKLALYYNVEIFYANDGLKDVRFSGYLKRYDKIDVILKAIEESVGVDCDLKNSTIVISKNK